MVCSACGQERPDGDRFCGICGTPLPHRPLSTPGAQSTVHLSRGPLDGRGRSAAAQNPKGQQSYGDEWTADPPAAEKLPSATRKVAEPPRETFEPALVLPERHGRESENSGFQHGETLADELPSNIVEDLDLPEFNQAEAASAAVETPASHSEVSDFLDELVIAPAEPSTPKEAPHFPWMDGVLEQIEFEAARTSAEADERPRFLDVLGDLSLPPLESDAPVPGALTPEPIIAGQSSSESTAVPRKITASPVADEGRTPLSRKQSMWLAAAAALVLAVLGAIQWRVPITRTSKHLVEVVTTKIEDLMGIGVGPAPTSTASSEPNPFSKAIGLDEQPKPQAQSPSAAASTSATAPSENPERAKAAAPPNAAPQVQTPPTQNPQTAAAKSAVPGETKIAAKTPATPKAGEVAKLWKATATGNPNAPLRLAEMYVKGDGVPRSCEQAVVLLKTAALRENADACNRLATMYADATCVQRDRIEAYRWARAALTANPGSQSARQNRDRIWEDMTPDERMQTQRSP